MASCKIQHTLPSSHESINYQTSLNLHSFFRIHNITPMSQFSFFLVWCLSKLGEHSVCSRLYTKRYKSRLGNPPSPSMIIQIQYFVSPNHLRIQLWFHTNQEILDFPFLSHNNDHTKFFNFWAFFFNYNNNNRK